MRSVSTCATGFTSDTAPEGAVVSSDCPPQAHIAVAKAKIKEKRAIPNMAFTQTIFLATSWR